MTANGLVLDKPLPLISYSDSGILGLKTCGLVAHGNQSDSSFYFSNAVQKMKAEFLLVAMGTIATHQLD